MNDELPEPTLNGNYWNSRWQKGETGWDIGYPSPAIADYTDQLPGKDIAILIPGCGNGYEAQYLLEKGFTNVTLLDIAPNAVAALQQKFAGKKIDIICDDFFKHEGQYDLMLEQTFFCALPRDMRADYVRKAASLLNKGGKIAGVLFKTEFDKEGPPFGGSAGEYKKLFTPYFNLLKMQDCYNSILPRQGNELFIVFQKK